MRFVQFLRRNDTLKRLGVLSEDGNSLTELSFCNTDMVDLISKNLSVQEITNKLKGVESEPVTEEVEFLPPITNPSKIVCIGLNYRDHCEEQHKTVPKEPMFFSKFASALVGPYGNVIAHKITNKLDWEVELAVIIGKRAKSVVREEAMDYVFGYTVAQDISARDWQKERNGGQFLIGKSMDTFCPLGPAIVHKSLIANPYNLQMITTINGVEKQNGNTKNMIFRIDDVISRLTESMTLLPGDIILTGTPKGVGMHRNPPQFLQPGDVIDTEIQFIGKIRNIVVAP